MDMDSKIQTLLDAKLKQIDIELEQELIKIGEEYSRRGIPGSGLHLRAQGLAKIKANAKKDEIRAQFELQESRTKTTLSPYLAIPPYNKEKAQINLGGKYIQIPPNTKMETLCRVIFSEKLGNMWSWDEIMLHKEWGEREEDLDKRWREIHSAVYGVNEKVERKTLIKDFLLHPTIKQVQINPKYLR